jgi:NDP-sugar pyrophosphorylase family protein
MTEVHIVGNGGHAMALASVIVQNGAHVGKFIVRENPEQGEILESEFFNNYAPHESTVAVGVGGIRNLSDRYSIFKTYQSMGYKLPAIVSKFASVSPSSFLAEGAQVFPMAVVGAGVKVGEACLINTGAIVEHGSNLDFGCHISTGARVNGESFLGALVFVGSGAVLEQGIHLGNERFIKMGQIVLAKDVG